MTDKNNKKVTGAGAVELDENDLNQVTGGKGGTEDINIRRDDKDGLIGLEQDGLIGLEQDGIKKRVRTKTV